MQEKTCRLYGDSMLDGQLVELSVGDALPQLFYRTRLLPWTIDWIEDRPRFLQRVVDHIDTWHQLQETQKPLGAASWVDGALVLHDRFRPYLPLSRWLKDGPSPKRTFPPGHVARVGQELCRRWHQLDRVIYHNQPQPPGSLGRIFPPWFMLGEELGFDAWGGFVMPHISLLLATAGWLSLHHSELTTAERPSFRGKIYFSSLPPEIISGYPTGQRGRVYQIGLLLYVMLTNHWPFIKGSDLETLESARRGEFPRLTDFRSDVPDGLQALIAHSTALEQGRRPESLLAFADALAPWAQEESRYTAPSNEEEALLMVRELLHEGGISIVGMFDHHPETLGWPLVTGYVWDHFKGAILTALEEWEPSQTPLPWLYHYLIFTLPEAQIDLAKWSQSTQAPSFVHKLIENPSLKQLTFSAPPEAVSQRFWSP